MVTEGFSDTPVLQPPEFLAMTARSSLLQRHALPGHAGVRVVYYSTTWQLSDNAVLSSKVTQKMLFCCFAAESQTVWNICLFCGVFSFKERQNHFSFHLTALWVFMDGFQIISKTLSCKQTMSRIPSRDNIQGCNSCRLSIKHMHPSCFAPCVSFWLLQCTKKH